MCSSYGISISINSQSNEVTHCPNKVTMRAKCSKVELEGWEDNAFRVTLIDLQQKEWEKVEMSMSTQRHGTLYKSKEILHMY
jgi:hypothetical protein